MVLKFQFMRMSPRVRLILMFILDVSVNAVVIIGLVILLRVFVISPFQVHGPSMCDNFNNFEGTCIRGDGEFILLYKFGYQSILGWQVGLPERGDVVVFEPPAEPGEYYIKRVIGLSGETVEFKDGYVYIVNEENPNGFKLDESGYLNSENWGNTDLPYDSETSFTVPEGSYFLMGDNRRASSDARRCFADQGCDGTNTPYVTLDKITGRAWFAMWPLNRMRVVPEPTY